MQKLCCVRTRQHPLPVWSHKFVISSLTHFSTNSHPFSVGIVSLQCCFNQIIMPHGNNNYNINILGKSNWNEMEIYPMQWMWWRMWQTYTTTMTQMMVTATMTTLMRKKMPKNKRIPSVPTHKWKDGGYSQRLSHRCRSRNRCVLVVVVVPCMSFPQTLVKVCVFLVCGCFFLGVFLSVGVCVE